MVIVTLPAYNEEQTLPLVLEAVCEAMEENHVEYRVLVVNDGSTDGTARAAEKLLDRMPLAIVEHERNRGLGEALRTGLVEALATAGDRDIIVTMDSDNTHTPGLIARMVRGVREGNDVVIASRYHADARIRGVPLHRRLLSRGSSWLFRLTFPTRGVRDFTCGFRAYRAGILKQAFAVYGDAFVAQTGFSCMVDILLKLRRMDAIMTEVPLILRYDLKFSASKMELLRTTLDTLRLALRRRLGFERE
jgi:dolichol-phosphate mannosyltransferase